MHLDAAWRSMGTAGWMGDGLANAFRLDEGKPSDGGMKFCCYCGKKLEEVPWSGPEEEESEDVHE